MNNQLILVLDFGGQHKELIAGAVRGLSVYSEIHPGSIPLAQIRQMNPIGIILTGGEKSDALKCSPELFSLGIPVLGICHGMQLMCRALGGKVESDGAGERGLVEVTPVSTTIPKSEPFRGFMNHVAQVVQPPEGFEVTMRTASCIAAMEHSAKKLYGVQFHPEIKHTENGTAYIKWFLYDVCGAKGDYQLDDYIETQIRLIREKVGHNQVLLGLSGGVDSSVCAALLTKAVPRQLTCIFVDHGFMRHNEGNEIEAAFAKKSLKFIRVNAQERFLAKIKGVTDSEQKRKLIGEEFVRVFEEQARLVCNTKTLRLVRTYLAQGTIYPDIVESGGEYGATIKSHHNVGGLPEDLSFAGIVEPLAGLFKEEVRVMGRRLGLPLRIVKRQPFPGPGLAIRVMGEVTARKLDIVRQADAIVRQELYGHKHIKPDQYFAILSDTRSVGVKGDERTYDLVVAIRAVNTDDFMTCEYTQIPHSMLGRISSRITSEIPTVSRVVYDITSKPPATVEWE